MDNKYIANAQLDLPRSRENLNVSLSNVLEKSGRAGEVRVPARRSRIVLIVGVLALVLIIVLAITLFVTGTLTPHSSQAESEENQAEHASEQKGSGGLSGQI